jgi:hypothetical protein
MTTTKTTNAKKTDDGVAYHRDGTVTMWDVHTQQWVRTGEPSDQQLASLDHEVRRHVMEHVAVTADHIRALAEEAGEAGDERQVTLCRLALRDGPGSRRWMMCEIVIRDARAQQ